MDNMVQCKKVNKVFAIGSRSFVNGASLRSYNEFVGLRSGVNFIYSLGFIHCERFTKCFANEWKTPIHREQFLKVVKYKLKCSHLTN